MDFPDVDMLGLGSGRGVAAPWSTHVPEVDEWINWAGKAEHAPKSSQGSLPRGKSKVLPPPSRSRKLSIQTDQAPTASVPAVMEFTKVT